MHDAQKVLNTRRGNTLGCVLMLLLFALGWARLIVLHHDAGDVSVVRILIYSVFLAAALWFAYRSVWWARVRLRPEAIELSQFLSYVVVDPRDVTELARLGVGLRLRDGQAVTTTAFQWAKRGVSLDPDLAGARQQVEDFYGWAPEGSLGAHTGSHEPVVLNRHWQPGIVVYLVSYAGVVCSFLLVFKVLG